MIECNKTCVGLLALILGVICVSATASALPKTIWRAKLCQDTKACLEGKVPGCPETEEERSDLETWFADNCPEFDLDLPATPVETEMTGSWGGGAKAPRYYYSASTLLTK